MTEKAQHKDPQDKKGFSKGKTEAPKRKTGTVKDTAKTREAKASKGGRERNPG